MWCDGFLVDQPIEIGGCPIGGVSNMPVGLDAKASLGSQSRVGPSPDNAGPRLLH